jgi:hypothetical protein
MSTPWWWQVKLRPHHLLDIITQLGQGQPFVPSDYGHAVHTVAQIVIADPKQQVELVVGADAICAPCRFLLDGRCTDTIPAFDPPASKQEYNDALDRQVLAHLGLHEGQVLTVRRFAETVLERLTGLEQVCSHPGEQPVARLRHLRHGLQKLGLWLTS